MRSQKREVGKVITFDNKHLFCYNLIIISLFHLLYALSPRQKWRGFFFLSFLELIQRAAVPSIIFQFVQVGGYFFKVLSALVGDLVVKAAIPGNTSSVPQETQD